MADTYERLTEPLIRRNGVLTPATWDEALDAAADGFRRVLDVHGSDALGIFSCSRSTNEMNYLAGKLARTVFRNHHVDSCNRT
jgi:predicted molibdopterin-dependent oxidoreductase YjgC